MPDPIPKIIREDKYEVLRSYIPQAVAYENEDLVTYYQTLLDVARWAGLRRGEALNLRLENIDWTNSIIIINKQKNGWKRYPQPCPIQLMNQLKKHVEEYREELKINSQKQKSIKEQTSKNIKDKSNSPYIFYNNKPFDPPNLRYSGVQTFMSRLREASGFTHIYDYGVDGQELHVLTYHTLRHLYGTQAYDNTGDIRAAQVLLRHKSLTSTEIYVHTSLKRKQQFMKMAFEDCYEDNIICSYEQ